tara:strand:- start:1358 stop:3031 length:1674 start_codon:yes stop_codon:yes gene_type:complete
MIDEKEYRILIEQLATGGITGNKTYHQYHDQFVPIDSEGAGYANGGGVGTMMVPRQNFRYGGGADYMQPLGYVEDTSLEVEDSTPNNSGFMITAADALPDQTGTIKAAPKIMENAGVTTITNSGINSFQRPNMREVAGEYLPFNVNNLGNPNNDKRVVSEELGITGYGKPNMRQVAGETNIDRFSNNVAPVPSTPEIYQDLIMNPEYMPNRLQNLERFADNRFEDLDFKPGFNFVDAPNKVTNLKEFFQNKGYNNNPYRGIIDNTILSRGNEEKSLVNKTKNMFSNFKDGITSIDLPGKFKEGAKLAFTPLMMVANARNPLNPKASNYNPDFANQLNFADSMGMIVTDPNTGLDKFSSKMMLDGELVTNPLQNKNAVSLFGTNDVIEMLEKTLAKQTKTYNKLSDVKKLNYKNNFLDITQKVLDNAIADQQRIAAEKIAAEKAKAQTFMQKNPNYGNNYDSGKSYTGASDSYGSKAGTRQRDARSSDLGFSDIRLKDNIELVGKSPSDINIYNFTYLNNPKVYQGVMAHEVPWASVKHNSGYLMVDYNKVDVDFKLI